MKTHLSIFLLIFYTVFSFGIQVNKHYCMGELASVNFFVGESKCACGKPTKPKKCCQDESQTFQIDDEQQKTALSFDFSFKNVVKNLFVIPFSLAFPFQKYLDKERELIASYRDNSPPFAPKVPLYLFHGVLRI